MSGGTHSVLLLFAKPSRSIWCTSDTKLVFLRFLQILLILMSPSVGYCFALKKFLWIWLGLCSIHLHVSRWQQTMTLYWSWCLPFTWEIVYFSEGFSSAFFHHHLCHSFCGGLKDKGSIGSDISMLGPQLVELFGKDWRYALVGRGMSLGVDLEVSKDHGFPS